MIAATMFSGIGAPEQAMPDWTWLWHAEIDTFASAVMKHHHPGSKNLGDICAEDFIARARRRGRARCIVFGSPCQDFSVRRLTPRECERLQGFPDDYTLIQYRRQPAFDTPRYQVLGNSMNVKDIGAVLRRIETFERVVPR